MTDKHTPGKLTIQPYVDAIYLLAEDGSEIASVADRCIDLRGMPPDNARRLKTCWNACDGISTEALEAGVVKALLAACKAVETWWLAEGREGFNGAPACMFDLRAAVALAEAPQ